MMLEPTKVMTAKEAISCFVNDGESLIVGNYTEGLPFNLIFEIIRQKKVSHIIANPEVPMRNSSSLVIAWKRCVPLSFTNGADALRAAWWNVISERESYWSKIIRISLTLPDWPPEPADIP